MGVAGVALATIISQAISAALVVWVLASGKSSIQFNIRKLEWKWEYFVQILRIGIPAGLQGSLFALSNVLIQSSINSFGSVAMAGNSAASNIEGFIYTSMNAFQQTSTSFTSQNMGGGKYKRVNKVLVYCLLGVTVLGCTLGFTAYFFGETLLSLYNDNAEVIQFGLERMSVICVTYALCGIMDTLVGAIRGLGSSVLPMIVSLLGACGFRILWIATIFAEHRTLLILYISYPVSWILTSAVHVICFFVVRKKVFPKK